MLSIRKLVLILLCIVTLAEVRGDDIYSLQAPKFVPKKEQADRFGRLYVQTGSGHKLEQVQTYFERLADDLYGAENRGELSSVQLVLGWMMYPRFWDKMPALKNKNNSLYFELQQGKHLPIFPLPGDPDHRWFSPGEDLSAFSGKDSLLVSHIFPWYLNELIASNNSGDWTKPDEILGMIETYQKAQTTLELKTIEPAKKPENHPAISNRSLFLLGMITGICVLLIVVFLIKTKNHKIKTKR